MLDVTSTFLTPLNGWRRSLLFSQQYNVTEILENFYFLINFTEASSSYPILSRFCSTTFLVERKIEDWPLSTRSKSLRPMISSPKRTSDWQEFWAGASSWYVVHSFVYWLSSKYQAFFLVEDDIMDGATTRRGQPCWYRQNNIGLSAINDGLLLEQSIFQLLRTHFKDKACYLNLVEVFHENILKTTMGQTLDLISTHFGQKPKLELFTMDQYNAIVKYKTAYYSFVMPVSLAMYFAGITDPEMHRQAKTILLEMGHFFQVQDDFLDCYGDPEVTGKIGTDIQDGKCSWLAVVALQRATPAQKKILEECYGSSDPAKVDRVKQLYNSLGLQTTYSVYEEESYNLMNTHIQQISRGLPHDLFFKFLEKIYRRDS
ncbi:farnesyl pyrophosphate synthase isoform X2 [Neodiprion virginianus]|uniref:farnesyl pyrophosphate synthase isoform X2 n=1 Tax=Neodiprion fabricii TaxID=2872261 RepID=UPI001ED92AA2|nr:farnesyl pyrophosphate synthase isoform X2 [Neodiprion fabricii]XP_046429085.1 farnesyl pyrophosphate synthase isoform X2 [Neodiprion fabricii]XP_046429086.1 farnesyl pyrophosphate synthase isoform X2 [Neodiprion fabricii]XP_046620712.1 farnesyl pyrophosphate synthase isoform X2 [Neodiprion virginianus]XP_046620715.1 farnesyl pyrophosphate synthase isoform X2 [Neodiprion virginianus]XP_046620716.1 farnesyl pyrophosphate synthase isoform X2 [Neodiprion virginianus]